MIIRPETPSAAAAAIAEADGPVIIRGAGTRAGWQPEPVVRPGEAPEAGPDGGPCAGGAEPLILETTRLAGPGDLRPDNLSATFPAGTPLTVVDEQLRAAGLWLPVEHMDSKDATLGGCLAAGFASPLRLGYGPPRDWVLGLEVATGRGLMRFGGDVVKNVAGYDLVKLHLGAWGRFGLITRATLRLLPLPEAACTVTASFADAAAADIAVRAAMASGSRPAALELTGSPGRFRLVARLVGEARLLEARAAALRAAFGGGAVQAGAAGDAEWQACGAGRAALAGQYPWRLRLAVPAPGAGAALSLLAGALAGREWAVAGHAGSGLFTAWWDDPMGPAPAQARLRHELSSPAAVGFVQAEGAAARAMTGQPGWVSFPPRPPRSQDRLEAALRAALAPHGSFNPHLPGPPGEASV